jgi:deoxyribodipyrimidine photo-lyase
LNISLQAIETESYKNFYENLIGNKNFSIYWNKVYEPDYLKFDETISNIFKKKTNTFQIFKGNILNEPNEINKKDKTPFKVFTPFWRTAEKYYEEKIPPKFEKVLNCKVYKDYFQKSLNFEKILPKKNWFNKFEKNWFPSEEHAYRELKNFVNNKVDDYADARNFPNLIGTSKLSPFIKHGQIHVDTIWKECKKSKKKGISKFLAEIGWREFNHSLINNFSYMLKENYSKKFDKFPWEKNSKFFVSLEKRVNRLPNR